MKRCASYCRILACCAVGAVAAACAPLTGAASGSATGTCLNTLFSVTADAFPTDQQQINSSQSIAQSLVMTPGQSISSLSLRLEGFSSTNPSSLAGSLVVYVVPDLGSGSTPTQPRCSPQVGAIGCAATALSVGFLDLATVKLFQPKYYNIPLSMTVKLTGNNPTPIWIVATSAYPSGSTNSVSWDGNASTGNPQLLTVGSNTNFGSSNWNPINQNMTFQACR